MAGSSLEFIGQSIKPREARRLLKGGGTYVSDIHLPHMAHAAVLRRIHAHARIRALGDPDGVAGRWRFTDHNRRGCQRQNLSLPRQLRNPPHLMARGRPAGIQGGASTCPGTRKGALRGRTGRHRCGGGPIQRRGCRRRNDR